MLIVIFMMIDASHMIVRYPYPSEFIEWMRFVFANPDPFIAQCVAAYHSTSFLIFHDLFLLFYIFEMISWQSKRARFHGIQYRLGTDGERHIGGFDYLCQVPPIRNRYFD